MLRKLQKAMHLHMYVLIAFLNVIIYSSVASKYNGTEFRFLVNKDGTYNVQINDVVWLNSSCTAFQLNAKRYSSQDESLKLLQFTSSHGVDELGMFTRYGFQYHAGEINVSTSARIYFSEKQSSYQYAVFSQEFPEGASKTSVGNMDKVNSEFPSFQIAQPAIPLGFLVYSYMHAGYERLTIDKWLPGMKQLPGGLNTGPLILFDKNDNVIIISALNHFTAASYYHDKSRESVAWGIMGNVDTVPQGYKLETIVYASSKGINEAMADWGTLLCTLYGRTSEAMDSDVTVNYLGFYTDNGWYYYHQTEANKTYEDTLFDIYNYSLTQNIPYRYIQYDDWWYYIEQTKTAYGAELKWEAMPSVFPHGIQNLYEVMKLPVIAHNRYWSYKTPYAKANNGSWDFVIDEKAGMSLPIQQEFWEWLFYEAKTWGLVTFESDFMCTQMEKIKELNTDIALAEKWLIQMGRAAARYNLKLQYCMSLPRQILQALEIPPVSHARASGDYAYSPLQWRIGVTSIFLRAMRIAPFKDNFWTSSIENGNPYGRKELNPVRQALVALLSTGPVGVSDKVGLTNTSITSRLCRSDGLLLKPGRPTTAINAQIFQSAFGDGSGPSGDVWSSVYEFSKPGQINDGLYTAVVFASELTSPYSLTLRDIGIEQKENLKYMIYNMDDLISAPKMFDVLQLDPVQCGKSRACVFYVSLNIPLKEADDFVFMGELSKYVPWSPQRIENIDYQVDDESVISFTFHLRGAGMEQVTMYYYAKNKVRSLECVMSEYGRATLHFPTAECNSN